MWFLSGNSWNWDWNNWCWSLRFSRFHESLKIANWGKWKWFGFLFF